MRRKTRKINLSRIKTSFIILFFALILTPLEVEADLLVSSRGTGEIIRYDRLTGDFIDVFASAGGQGLIFGPDGNLYVCLVGRDRILRFDGSSGVFMDTFVSTGSGGLDSPTGLTFGPDGNLYVSSTDTHSILRYDGQTGDFKDVFASGGGLRGPFGLSFGPDSNLYVSNQGWAPGSILRYDGITGEFNDAFVPHWSSPLSNPLGLVFGPDDNLYVASNNSSQVLRYNGTTGQFIDVFTSGNELLGPFGLVFGADSNLYVTDISNDYVLRYDGITGDFIDIFATGGGLDTPTFLIFSPSAEILYQNNFDDGNLDDWTHIPSYNGTILGIWSVVDGALQIDISSGGDAQNFKLNTLVLPESYIIEFDTRTILDGGGTNLIAFYTHWSNWGHWVGNHYRPGRFLLNGTGIPDHLVHLYHDADPSQWHHFKYIRDGNLVSLFFDSMPVYEDYVLSTPLTGEYFVLAGAFSGIHQFDNLVIETLGSYDCRVSHSLRLSRHVS